MPLLRVRLAACAAVVAATIAHGCTLPDVTRVDAAMSRPDASIVAPTDVAAEPTPDVAPLNADADGDTICDVREGDGDADGDGIPNRLDPDADNDGRADALEAARGAPYDCRDEPADSDRDGTPDFLDTDSDGNGIPDARDFIGLGAAPSAGWPAAPSDWDHDGVPDYADPDDDGDGIPDVTEIAPGGAAAPTDTDRDGTPDYRDDDADGDTIRDADETGRDQDGDRLGNWRDDDSDGDGISDRDEAGDMMPATQPAECARELDAATLWTVHNDGLPDFRDNDSDNDALSDRDEVREGTDRCNPDTDGDGQLDSAEVRWCRLRGRSGCALDAAGTIPPSDVLFTFPDFGPAVQREFEFRTDALPLGARRDLTLRLRNDPANPEGSDATSFVSARSPSCYGPPANTACWTEPAGVAHADAVAGADMNTMFGVLAGTRVRWAVRLWNNGTASDEVRASVAAFAIDLMAGDAVVDTRVVVALIPTRLGGI